MQRRPLPDHGDSEPENAPLSVDEIELIGADANARKAYENGFGEQLYPTTFFCLTGESFAPPEHAWTLWRRVDRHRQLLTETPGKDPGFTFSTLDFFANWLRIPGAERDLSR